MFRLKKIRLLYPAAKPSNSNNNSNKNVITYPKSWTGPWTLDSGLWTLDSGLFLPKLYPLPRKKPLYLPTENFRPPKKNFLPPNKKFNYIGFFLINKLEVCEISNKQRYSPPPTHVPEKTLMSPP